MQLNVPPDLETLINKRLSSDGYTSVEDVLRRALEAQDAEENWTDEERRALSFHIEEGYLRAERSELIEGAKASREWTLTRYPNHTVVYRLETSPLQVIAVQQGKRNMRRILKQRP